jgi:beta-lactamase regulating signal transducer with metallopeptidase domain
MIAWGITYLIHSTLLFAVVYLTCRVIRSASARDTLWKIALFAPLVTATLQTALPLREVMRESAPPRIEVDQATISIRTIEMETTPAPAGAAPIRPLDPMRVTPLVAWAVVASLLLLRLIVGQLLFLRALRDREELPIERERLQRIAMAMGHARSIRLTESAAVGSPIAMPHWEVVVPRATFARLTDQQKDTILAHEVAHLLRRDPLWLIAAEIVKAIAIVQPLNWLAQKRMKECAEFLCDDLALMHTRDPKALAETLTELAATLRPTPRAVAAMAENGSNLLARVTRALTYGGERPLRLITRLALGTAVLMALAAFAPGIVPVLALAPVTGQGESPTMQLGDVELSRSFDGSEGKMHILLMAHELLVPEDATWFRFRRSDGYLRVQQTSEKGPIREIDMTAGPNLQAIVRYRVAGREVTWDETARQIVLQAFKSTVRTPRAKKFSNWEATVHLTGTHDDEDYELRLEARGVKYDKESGEVVFGRGSSVIVEETVGAKHRSFRREENSISWNGDFEGDRVEWLAAILKKQSSVPMNVGRAMARQ